jgi:hypothetical protein
MDPLALGIDDCRFMAHKFVRPKAEILAEIEDDPDSGWNEKLIRSLEPGEASFADSPMDLIERQGKNYVARDEVIGVEMWVPEIETGDPAEGFHGTLFTLCYDSDDKDSYLRDPRPFYGPPEGPYVVFGAYQPPDTAYPLSPLVACEGQIREMNKHAKAISRNAAERKKIILYDEMDTDAAEKIIAQKDSLFVGIPNANKDSILTNIEVGGIDAQQVTYYELLRDRVYRALGTSESRSGNPSDTTATAVAVAEQGSNARLGYLKKAFARGAVQVLDRAGWYLYHDDDVVFGLGETAAELLNMVSPVFQGGGHDPESGLTYDDLELELEPMSMERASEGLQAARTSEAFNMLGQFAPIMAQTPWIDWKTMLNKYGDSRNLTTFGDLFREDIASKMLGGPHVGPQGPGGASGTGNKFAGDLGQFGMLEKAVTESDFARQNGNAGGASAGKQNADSMAIPGGGG